MKLCINLMTLALIDLNASTIVIYDRTEGYLGKAVRERFINEYDIPAALISVYQTRECPRKDLFSNKLVVCVEPTGLAVLNTSPSIIESLIVFQSEKK